MPNSATDIVRSSLAAHVARDGRSWTALAESMWGPWPALEADELRLKRLSSAKRLRGCLQRGWISDPELARDWARAYGVSVLVLLFYGHQPDAALTP